MKIYCSGIGGIGLSAYASLQKLDGHSVQGSDRSDSELLEDLRTQEIGVVLDQSGKGVPGDADLFVYSEAIPPDAPERRRASELGIRQISYPQAVGELSREYDLIAVCGTHGKSSTTSMAARLLIEAGKDPTVIVGTKARELGGRNWRKGKSKIFLLEACEYRHSFLHYAPKTILLTTCDGDHFDFYKSQEDYEEAFVRFIRSLPKNGTLITHGSDPVCRRVAEKAGAALSDADDQPLIPLKTPGIHMRKNAQLVLALADSLGIPAKEAKQIVSEYSGSWRRMEVKGTYRDDITVIDDYAHHPAEIRATLQALREEYPKRRIVCIFQPHTHDRTIKLYKDFLDAFTDADQVIMSDVYEARKDIETEKANLPEFVRDISYKSGIAVSYGGSLQDIERSLPSILRSADVLVCMGAGDVTALAAKLSRKQEIP